MRWNILIATFFLSTSGCGERGNTINYHKSELSNNLNEVKLKTDMMDMWNETLNWAFILHNSLSTEQKELLEHIRTQFESGNFKLMIPQDWFDPLLLHTKEEWAMSYYFYPFLETVNIDNKQYTITKIESIDYSSFTFIALPYTNTILYEKQWPSYTNKDILILFKLLTNWQLIKLND